MYNTNGCTYRFIESSLSLLSNEIEYDIEIRQQPIRAKMSVINERDRRPIEPPPILQLHWKNCTEDELKKSLQSPFYFVVANIVAADDTDNILLPIHDYLSGPTVSSLHKLRDVDNSDGGFFVFGDLAVKKEGSFKLKFSLFAMIDGQVQNRKTLFSDAFTVYAPKRFPGPIEATFLSRTFSDQGVKMRVRKEHRLQSQKRKLNESDKKSSQIHERTIKKHQTCNTKMTLSSPSYAENTSSPSDVLFGRWQSNIIARASYTTPSLSSSSSTVLFNTGACKNSMLNERKTSATYDVDDYISYKTKLERKYPKEYRYPPDYLASPENSIDNSTSKNDITQKPSFHSIFNQSLSSPPSVVCPAYPSSLAQYHTESTKKTALDRLPSPPISIKEFYRPTTSFSPGPQLPPLRSMMNDHQNYHSSNHLLLPPLPPPCWSGRNTTSNFRL